MRTAAISLLFVLLAAPFAVAGEDPTYQDDPMAWHQLPALPDEEGFASPFAGLSNNALIVAGGANFPEKKPWEGGAKIYHDRIFVLEKPDGNWIDAGKLPRPLAYGVSITTPQGLVCIGGNDAQRAYADVFLMQWIDGKIRISYMPSLPKPITSATGALIGSTVYIAGGHDHPNPAESESLSEFLAFDLASTSPSWQRLEAWPGPGRFLPVAGVHEGSLYLFSGIRRVAAGEAFAFDYLTDAYRYIPAPGGGKGHWTELADLPRRNAAVPSPAPMLDDRRFVLLGSGADGGHSDKPMSEHPGFLQSCLIYDIEQDRWSIAGRTPAPRVCAPMVLWHDQWIIISGEIRPGVRSPQVWAGRPRTSSPRNH
jgi:N-acetylneuraminate epimerase